jgi:hypothetical protein
MRYGVGSVVDCEVRIAAEPDLVWTLVSDIELPARFSPELQRVRWLDDVDTPTVGARFEGINSNPVLGQWRSVSHVVEVNPARTLSWVVVDADGQFGPPGDPSSPVATWRFDLEPADGGTLLRHSVRIGPGRSGLTATIDRMPEQAAEILQFRLGQLYAGMQDTLFGIKALAEGDGTASDAPAASTGVLTG